MSTRYIKIFLAIAMLLISGLLISGCTSKNNRYMNNTDIINNLNVTVELEKTSFKQGEIIPIKIILKNGGVEPIMLKNSNIIINISLPKGSALDHIDLELMHDYIGATIEPGKYIIETITWDQKYIITPNTFEAISGTYNLKTNVSLKTRTSIKEDLSTSNFEIDPVVITIT